MITEYKGIIDRYRERLPVSDKTPVVSLGEGNTPLLPLNNIEAFKQAKVEVYVKYEGLNPSGSFKDRGMTMAISKAKEEGGEAVICASTGNTSASAAAYAAAANMKSFVLIPEGKIALGKLAQAVMHGAKVLQIKGNFDEGMQLVNEIAKELPLIIVNSINPYRPEGQKTASFEIIETLNRAPDFHAVPVGNAKNIVSYWKGYQEYHQDGLAKTRPKMLGYQSTGAAPFTAGHPIDNPETVATAIRIGKPLSWDLAWEAQKASNGWFDAIPDQQILSAQSLLAAREGIFAEPAAAASVAGLLQDCQNGKIPSGSTVVCTLTGHGLKDPDIAIQQNQGKLQVVEAKLAAVREAIEKQLTS